MLVLTFQVGDERLALDIRNVAEVVPRVRLRRPAGAPPWLAGCFVYRGRIVPVVDLHRLIGAGECPPHLSSRIVLVNRTDPNGAWLLGLLAARVDDVREVETAVAPLDRFTAADQPDLGPLLVDKGQMLRRLELDRLLPAPLQRLVMEKLGEA